MRRCNSPGNSISGAIGDENEIVVVGPVGPVRCGGGMPGNGNGSGGKPALQHGVIGSGRGGPAAQPECGGAAGADGVVGIRIALQLPVQPDEDGAAGVSFSEG